MKYYFMAFKNYAKCEGRASRKEFWWFILFHSIIMFVLSFGDSVLDFYPTDIPIDYGYMTLIYLFVSACPAICLQVRRLHDVGKSGSWWWLTRVPIVSLYIFYLNCKASEPGINYYGMPTNYVPTPVYNEDKETDNSNKIRFCRKCGYELVTGSDFCSQCGTKIIETVEMNQNEVL